MMSSVLHSACQAEKYITSDIAPTEKNSVVCDAQQLPFSDNAVDIIASFEVIEHIPETQRFLLEINRALKPKGYVVLSMPFLYGQQNYHRWIEQGLERVLGQHGMEIRQLKNGGVLF